MTRSKTILRTRWAAALATAGFAVGEPTAGDEGWTVPFARDDAPNRIDAVTAEILDLLEGMDDVGYVGWTCAVEA